MNVQRGEATSPAATLPSHAVCSSYFNYILLPLMRFQDVQQGCVSVSHTVMGTLFPALFSRLSVQYVLLFLNKKSNCKYNNYYFHLYFHEA